MARDITRTARQVRAVRRAVPVLLTTVGLIFSVIGAWLMASQTWSPATGTVGDCTTRVERTGTGAGSSRTVRTCAVTWRADGESRDTSIELGTADAVPGRTVRLRVNGGNAVVATPLWVGVATAGVGLTLVVTGAVLLVRQRRTAA